MFPIEPKVTARAAHGYPGDAGQPPVDPTSELSLDSPVGLSPDIHLVTNSCGREI